MHKLETCFKSLLVRGYTKIIFAIDSILIFFISGIIVRTQPASGYEISIYDAYPWYFWLIISILIASPLIAILLENIAGQLKFSYINLTVFYALFSIILLLTLPAFRGYPFYGAGDTHSHLGLIKEISSTGHFGTTNPYPAVHILLDTLAIISSCSAETLSLYITQILFTLYIAFIFFLSRALKCSYVECLSITSFAILPALGYWLTDEHIIPSTDAFFLVPLVLFCVTKARLADNKVPYSVLSILLLVLFPFIHIETTMFLFVALIILSLTFEIKGIRKNAYIAAIILLIGCFTWVTYTFAFSGSIRSVYDSVILGLTKETPPIESIASGFRVGIVDVINGIIRIYGPALLYLIIGGSLSIYKLIKFISKVNVSFLDIFLSTLLSVYAVIHLVFLSTGAIIGFNIFRQVKYSIMISSFIIGLFFTGWLSKNRKIACYFLLFFSIVVISILMVNSIYLSPSSYGINCQPTYSDSAGMNFLFNNRNNTILILEPIRRAYQTRWSALMDIKNKSAIRWGYKEDVKPPDHFGYDRFSHVHLGDFYKYDQYLLVYPPCEIYYPSIYPNYPEFWAFSPEDFKLLYMDPTVNIIYSNYALKIMLVHP